MVQDTRTGELGVVDVKSAKSKFSHAFATDWEERIDKLSSMDSLVHFSDLGWYAEDLPAFLEEFDDEFKKDNALQINLYCLAPFSKERNVTHGSLYYYAKNSSDHIEIRFKPDQSVFDQVRDKFTRVYELCKTATPEQVAATQCDFLAGTAKHAFCDCHAMSGRDPKAALDAYFQTFPKKRWPTDIEKLKDQFLQDAFVEFEGVSEAADRLDKIEQEICKKLLEKKVSKVRLPNGHVYELKQYKTGGISNGPRVAIKRSKA
jgi:hypothetical protein